MKYISFCWIFLFALTSTVTMVCKFQWRGKEGQRKTLLFGPFLIMEEVHKEKMLSMLNLLQSLDSPVHSRCSAHFFWALRFRLSRRILKIMNRIFQLLRNRNLFLRHFARIVCYSRFGNKFAGCQGLPALLFAFN